MLIAAEKNEQKKTKQEKGEDSRRFYQNLQNGWIATLH